MVKQCRVLLHNDLVTVVRFGEKNVQLPSIGKGVDEVYVAYENGKYFVVNENYANKAAPVAKPVERVIKKTTDKNEEETVNE